MVRDITLGQFLPGDSLMHRLDPRAKLGLTLSVIVFIFVAGNFLGLAVMTGLVFLGMAVSGVSIGRYLKSLKVVLLVVLFTSLLNLFYGGGEVLWEWGFLRITWGGVSNSIFVAVRIIVLIFASSVLTFTTSPTQLTDALERLMKPLSLIRVPVHEIAMMMTIALRFIPTLLEETDKIMNAQKARGADMESGGILKRVKALVPVLVPLFVSSFRRAYELATAMECRCYRGGKGRTKMKILHMKARDYISCGVAAAAGAGVILLRIFITHPYL